jgi:YgiT-type zinc finger domain-containing protein
MKCPICKGGETRPGRTAVTLERETTTLVFKAVPAEVCQLRRGLRRGRSQPPNPRRRRAGRPLGGSG